MDQPLPKTHTRSLFSNQTHAHGKPPHRKIKPSPFLSGHFLEVELVSTIQVPCRRHPHPLAKNPQGNDKETEQAHQHAKNAKRLGGAPVADPV